MSRSFRQWSSSRPVKPDEDSVFEQIRVALTRDSRSTWTKADESGLSPTTIRNWELGRVKRPQGVSLQMAAAFLGKRIVLQDERTLR